MSSALRRSGLTLLALGLVAAPAAGQSVADVVEAMFAELERQSEGIDNYTLVQTVMGFESEVYFEKEVVDGRTVFVPRETAAAGPGGMSGSDMTFGNFAEAGADLIDHGRYVGREDLDGREVHVIAVDDMSALDFGMPRGGDMEFVPTGARFYVDAENWLPRRLAFDGQATTDTGVHEVTMVADMLDYRDVQGLMLSHRTVVRFEGLDAMIDDDMRAEFERMMAQLEQMSPQERAMMERMMGPQMEQIREMMEGGGGGMTMEITVAEVRVNQGPPGR